MKLDAVPVMPGYYVKYKIKDQEPIVSVGQKVLQGQKIANGEMESIHSAVSGIVREVDLKKSQQIIIENDNEYVSVDFWAPRAWNRLSLKEIQDILANAGVVDFNKDAVPMKEKLLGVDSKDIELVYVNVNKKSVRLTNQVPELLEGLKILLHYFKNAKGVFSYGNTQLKEQILNEENIEISKIKPKKNTDKCFVIESEETLIAIFRAVVQGVPCIEKYVSGEGKTFRVLIGTDERQLAGDTGRCHRKPITKGTTKCEISYSMDTSKWMVFFIALIPLFSLGVIHHGIDSIYVPLLTMLSSLGTGLFVQKKCSSYLCMGLILGLLLPASTPWYICLIGGILTGILYFVQKVIHPIVATKLLLITVFSQKFSELTDDIITEGNYFDMFLGKIPGNFGDHSVILIIFALAILIMFNITDFFIPAFGIIGFILIGGKDVISTILSLCAGSFMFSICLLATDKNFAPYRSFGKICYGFFIGILAGIIYKYLGHPESVLYAIIGANLLSPIIFDGFRRNLLWETFRKE